MQEKIHTPWLDTYFVYTSSLDTFFMTILPAMCFFGFPEMAHGLLMVLALGAYCSSVLKDLFCSPRPFAPPVTRLSTRRFILVRDSDWSYSILVRLGIGNELSPSLLSINLFKGLSLSTHIESWLTSQTFQIPLVLIPLTLWAVHQHPQPVDDCPCFEDAIAFMSVLMGAFVARWGICYFGGDHGGIAGIPRTVIMLGSGWILSDGVWVLVDRGWKDVAIWWFVATVKMVFGILTIFAWRILAKSVLHILLPPIFRLVSRAVHLPHRRFYTPATEYKSVPSEFHSSMRNRENRRLGPFGLHPIPSVIDLPTGAGVGVEMGRITSDINGNSRELKMRAGGGAAVARNGSGCAASNDKESAGKDGQNSNIKHYDADVLTKVIVYAGIAILAGEILPLWFELIGWGVKSWV